MLSVALATHVILLTLLAVVAKRPVARLLCCQHWTALTVLTPATLLEFTPYFNPLLPQLFLIYCLFLRKKLEEHYSSKKFLFFHMDRKQDPKGP